MNFLFKNRTHLVLSLSLLAVVAKGNPLWEDIHAEVVGPYTEEPVAAQPQMAMSSLTVPASIDVEIQELASSLENDPLKIFEYVRNNVDYEAYYGLKKGAELTLLEGSGNDFDQCALLAALLQAAGYSPSFRHGFTNIPYDDPNSTEDIMGWLGISDDGYANLTWDEVLYQKYAPVNQAKADPWPSIPEQNKKNYLFLWNFLYNRGHPVSHVKYTNQMLTVQLKRLWVEVDVGGTVYRMDPSFKGYEENAGATGLLSETGYSRSALLSAAAGTSGSGYVQSLSNTGISNYLNARARGALDALAANHPNESLRELIGGKRIVTEHFASLADCFSLTSALPASDVFMSTIGDAYKVKVKFKTGTIDYEIPTSELKGRKVTLSFNGTTVELRFDDEAPVATTTVTGATFQMTITVTHINSFLNQSETKTYKRNDSFAYAILYGFSPSGRLLQKRYEQLNGYLDSGKSDSAREVRTELLNIMGLTWLYQTDLAVRILAQNNRALTLSHHRFGRMSQEEGFYVDVGLQRSGTWLDDGDTTDQARFDNVFHLGSLFASAMEHGVIEQMQPEASAVSTVNIIRKAISDGQPIYLTDATNWNTGANVKNQLSGYSTDQKNDFETMILNEGAKLLLPKTFGVTQGQWTGSGWVVRSPKEAGMIINGGYSGGYSTNYGYVSSPSIFGNIFSNPSYSYTPSSIPSFDYVPSYGVPVNYGSDPVDMRTGAFTYANNDITTGIESAPRGLSFTRSYKSSAAATENQNLGYGWSHSFHIRAHERTAHEEALGKGSPQQAAAMLVASLVASDLYRDNASPKEWGVSALTVGWFLDKMTNNAVSITIGHDTFQFIKQPDGVFEPPIGSTQTLTEVSGNYRLKQRHGNTVYFEPMQSAEEDGQRAQKIADVDGKEMTLVYLSGNDRIDYVQDAYGRRLTFGYTGERITSITDNTNTATSNGRIINFRFDSNGNLDRFTDPEGKFSYYIYAVNTDGSDTATGSSLSGPTDPSSSAASDHRIVRLRNHDGQIITQNVYDALGRVENQYLHGDQNKTWTLHYAGVFSTEEDPAGGVTTYKYDERGRTTGKIDPCGDETFIVYDGQDHVVSSTTADGETTVYHYDTSHNLMQVDYPRGSGSLINTYDTLNRPQTSTDPDGFVTTIRYFDAGFHAGKNRPREMEDPAGTTTYTYYDNATGVGNPTGALSSQGAAAAGMIKTITDGDNLTTTYAYDSYGHLDWVDAPGTSGQFRTNYAYDSRGDLDYGINPRGIRTELTYNKRRQPTKSEADKGGADEAVEEYAYDNQGRLEFTTSPTDNGGQRVRHRTTYSPTDFATAEFLRNETATESDDRVAFLHYDGRDWNDYSLDAADRRTDVVYYADREVERIERPLDRDSSFTVDGSGRTLGETNPGGPATRVFSFQYDVTSLADGDEMGDGYPRLIFTDADAITAKSEFDRRGNLRFYTNKRGHTFETRYDGLGRATHVITSLGKTQSTTYKHRGAIASVVEPSTQTTTFVYNPSTGRLQSITDSVGTINFSSYDANGNLLTLTEGSKNISRTYDRLDRVKSYNDANSQEVGYRYYDSGRLHKVIYPGGNESGLGHVEYTYWPTGRLYQVIDKLSSTSSPRITTYTWRNDGRLSSVVRPNGTRRDIQYDDAGRPWLIQETTAADAPIEIHKIGYHPSDEMSWLYQLPMVEAATGPPAPVGSMIYNADNQLATFEGLSVTHDTDGNMTHGPLPGGAMGTYTYNARNELTSAGGLTYTYNAEGQRIGISGNGDTISQVIDSNRGFSRPLVITKNGVETRYVYGVGLVYEVDAGGAATYYHHDQSGNTTALTDEMETVIERIRYAPFGTIVHRSNISGSVHDTPFLYGGFFAIQTDSNGLLHMRARYYNPTLRRFVNADPARDGWNWYAYANGNPLGIVDPSGLGGFSSLDALQTGLDFLGMVPVVGAVFDIANAGISLARGNYWDAAINFASAVPGIGDAIGGAKIASAGIGIFGIAVRYGDEASTLAKYSVGAAKKIVIGEDMARVGPYAKKIGAEIYEGMPGFKPGMEAEGLLHNQRIIQQKMAEGYQIIDIGPNFPRRAIRGGPQPAYQMERTITKGYEGYQKAFIRTGKDSLILPNP